MSDPISCLIFVSTYFVSLTSVVIATTLYFPPPSAKNMAPKATESEASAFPRKRLPFSPIYGVWLCLVDERYQDPTIINMPWDRHPNLVKGTPVRMENANARGILFDQKLERHDLVVISKWWSDVFPQNWGKNTSDAEKPELKPQNGDLRVMRFTRPHPPQPDHLQYRRDELNRRMRKKIGIDWRFIQDPMSRRAREAKLAADWASRLIPMNNLTLLQHIEMREFEKALALQYSGRNDASNGATENESRRDSGT